jgi:hypothetical protein
MAFSRLVKLVLCVIVLAVSWAENVCMALCIYIFINKFRDQVKADLQYTQFLPKILGMQPAYNLSCTV